MNIAWLAMFACVLAALAAGLFAAAGMGKYTHWLSRSAVGAMVTGVVYSLLAMVWHLGMLFLEVT